MKRLCVAALLFLIGCDNSDNPTVDGGPSQQKRALAGAWEEALDTNVMWFEGSNLDLDFDGDSVTVQESKWTDNSACVHEAEGRICTDFQWVNTYKGKYLVKDSVMELAFTFTGTTANRITPTHKMEQGSFRVRYTLKEAARKLVLEVIDRELPLAGKEKIILKRKATP